jgi:hypothetical protein
MKPRARADSRVQTLGDKPELAALYDRNDHADIVGSAAPSHRDATVSRPVGVTPTTAGDLVMALGLLKVRGTMMNRLAVSLLLVSSIVFPACGGLLDQSTETDGAALTPPRDSA